MILSICKLILILIIVPYLVGMVPVFFLDRSKRRRATVYVSGIIAMLALFQLICVPVIIAAPANFKLVVGIYSSVLAVLAVTGIVLKIVDIKVLGGELLFKPGTDSLHASHTREEIVMWAIAIVLIIFQMVMFIFTQSFDGDDAYYVVQSLLTTETDTMYSIKPYTGLSTSIDLRHALASMPMWIAYIARVSGIHSTIVAHSIMGLLFIPVLYMIYYQCGVILLGNDRKRIPIFMIFVSIMYIFGNVSIYTDATFMLTRTWQGKAILANIVIAAITWLLLAIYETDNLDKELRLGYWITLFLVNIVAAMCSTASVFLAAMLIGMSGLIMSILKKDIQVILRLLITCVPLVAYAAMYILI